MNPILERLHQIAYGDPWKVRPDLRAYLEELEKNPPQEKVPAKRTYSQNRALHKLFELWATALNESGNTVQLVLKEKIDLDWDGMKVKELLWRPAQQAILGKESTTELSKIEDIDLVYEHLNRHMAEKFRIHVPFPSYEIDQNHAPLISNTELRT